MIDYLRLRGLGVIKDAELDLAGGLTVLTGETGAGKTLILSGLDLLLGGKPRAGLVVGDEASVEGIWQLPAAHPALELVADAGGTTVDGQLVIGRNQPASGRGRCVAGGRAVPVGLLAELAEQLVTVHGQSHQLLLRKPAAQCELLDAFGGEPLRILWSEYREAHQAVVQADARLAASAETAAAVAAELSALSSALTEIENIDPLPGEDEELRAGIERLGRVQEFQLAVHEALEVFSASHDDAYDVVTMLDQARRSIDGVAAADPELRKLHDRTIELRLLAQDLGADLSRYLAGLEPDPRRLEAAAERLAAIASLTRRFGPTIADVVAWSQTASRRLMELEDQADTAGLRRTRDAARSRLAAAARALHQTRVTAATELAERVTTELRMLALPRAQLAVAVSVRPPVSGQEPLRFDSDAKSVGFGPSGVDEVQLLLAPHPGAQAVPIAKAASGGELSRVMLAIEVVLAADSPIGTYVFDEVDAGIGGKAAVEVGRRLARLAQHSQVIVVTHLAQVAAFADDHLVVEKSSDGSVTTASVRHVRGSDRTREIARMLSGHDDSPQAIDHAAELLRLAADNK